MWGIKIIHFPLFRQVSRRRRRLWDKNSRNRWIGTSCPKSQCTAPAQQRHGRVVGTKEKTRLPVLKGGVAWATAIHRGAAPWEIKAASSNSWYILIHDGLVPGQDRMQRLDPRSSTAATSSQRSANRCDIFIPGDVQCLLESTTTKGRVLLGSCPGNSAATGLRQGSGFQPRTSPVHHWPGRRRCGTTDSSSNPQLTWSNYYRLKKPADNISPAPGSLKSKAQALCQVDLAESFYIWPNCLKRHFKSIKCWA